MKLSELNELQKSHLAWRIDHKTGIGMITSIKIANGKYGDIDLIDVFKKCGKTDRSAKIQARKVINFGSKIAPNKSINAGT